MAFLRYICWIMNNFGHHSADDSELDEMNIASLEQLGENLKKLQMSHFSPMSRSMKSRIRSSLLQKIESGVPESVPDGVLSGNAPLGADVESESYLLDRLIAWIRDSSKSVVLNPIQRAIIREKLYALPAQSFAQSPFASWFSGGILKRFVASFSLAGVLGLSLFAYVLRVPVTYAGEFTVVHEVSGDVVVVRDGQSSPASEGFELREGDELRTGENGSAEVKYFDKSFTRLFANTDVAFQLLRSENFGVDHLVELDLERGTLWSSVFDFVKNSNFKVRSNDLVTSASKRATFSVFSENGTSQVQVFQNAVNVSVPDETKTIVKGFQLVTDAEAGSSDSVGRIEPISLKPSEKEWVSANLQKDAQLIDDVQKQNQGVVAGPLGILQENASLLLAFDSNEKFKLELNIAERSFYEVLNGVDVSADQVRASFDQLEAITGRVDSAANDDVKKLAAAVLQSARAKLLGARPDSSLYDVKIALEERDFLNAPPDQKLSVAIDQAGQFLAEAQVLQDKGLQGAYDKALDIYRQRVKDVDLLVSDRLSKKLAIDDTVGVRRKGLEVQYVAMRNPVNVVTSAGVAVAVASETPAGKSPSATVVVNEAAEIATTASGAGTAASLNVHTGAAEGASSSPSTASEHDISGGSVVEVGAVGITSDDNELPPKLQLSRD